ncbi:hypothetical protein BANRA_00018 [Klebsiella pneumoniae]|nr:hypothetical protein BANRA_00018 [Klebsiella pneumoniae]
MTYLGYVNGTRAALEVAIPGIGVIIQPARRWPAFNPTAVGFAERKRRSAALPMPCEPKLMHESHIQLTMVQLPGMNTAQFGWARNKMDQAMQPVPRSISRKSPPRLFTVIQRPVNELWVGKAPSSRSSAVFFPRLLDRLMVKKREGQFTGQPKSSDQQDDLFTPVRGNHPGHGPLTMAHGVKQSPSAPISRVAAGVG